VPRPLAFALITGALAAAACGGVTAPASTSDGGAEGPDGSFTSSSGGSGSGGAVDSGLAIDSGATFDATGSLDAISPPFDASEPPLDAALGALDAAPAGLAGFAFLVNHAVQSPLACPSDSWEFAPFPTSDDSNCNPMPPACPGVASAIVVNTGQVPLVYYATNLWSGGYVPGVLTGASYELAGVLAPGSYVDITSVFAGGITALLGASQPFSQPDAGKFDYDEGTIPWPQGVAGSGGATTMYVAQIDVTPSCVKPFQQW